MNAMNRKIFKYQRIKSSDQLKFFVNFGNLNSDPLSPISTEEALSKRKIVPVLSQDFPFLL